MLAPRANTCPRSAKQFLILNTRTCHFVYLPPHTCLQDTNSSYYSLLSRFPAAFRFLTLSSNRASCPDVAFICLSVRVSDNLFLLLAWRTYAFATIVKFPLMRYCLPTDFCYSGTSIGPWQLARYQLIHTCRATIASIGPRPRFCGSQSQHYLTCLLGFIGLYIIVFVFPVASRFRLLQDFLLAPGKLARYQLIHICRSVVASIGPRPQFLRFLVTLYTSAVPEFFQDSDFGSYSF